MKGDFYLEYYDNILRKVAKWRVVEAKLLYTLSEYQGTNRSFNRVLSNLEKTKLLKSTHLRGKSKFLYASPELNTIYKINTPLIQEESLVHESIITTVTNKMLEWSAFESATLPHELISAKDFYVNNLMPDSVLHGREDGDLFNLALEVELSRKSKTRVAKKLQDYLANEVFDHIFYIFNDRGTFEGYKRMLDTFIANSNEEKGQEASVRVMFGYYPSLYSNDFDLDLLEVYHLGKTTNLQSVFGAKKLKGVSHRSPTDVLSVKKGLQ